MACNFGGRVGRVLGNRARISASPRSPPPLIHESSGRPAARSAHHKQASASRHAPFLRLSKRGGGFYLTAAHWSEGGLLSDAIRERTDGPAGRAFRFAMAGGLLLVLAANLPGQMSLDSVVALVEARTNVRQTWAPAVS